MCLHWFRDYTLLPQMDWGLNPDLRACLWTHCRQSLVQLRLSLLRSLILPPGQTTREDKAPGITLLNDDIPLEILPGSGLEEEEVMEDVKLSQVQSTLVPEWILESLLGWDRVSPLHVLEIFISEKPRLLLPQDDDDRWRPIAAIFDHSIRIFDDQLIFIRNEIGPEIVVLPFQSTFLIYSPTTVITCYHK